jgi:hypothetical protein
MTQNTSSAVMQQRTEAHDSLDDFPTPPWATRALCEMLTIRIEGFPVFNCREPAANRGHMVKPLNEHFTDVYASDIHDYGVGFQVKDYLFGPCEPIDWTISNPPFRLAEQFIIKAIGESTEGVAMIVRSAFLEGQGRFKTLFNVHRPSHVFQFTERVVMHKGRLLDPNKVYEFKDKKTGKTVLKKPTTATAYCWVVWRKGHIGPTIFDWIAPCRKRLERQGDYT